MEAESFTDWLPPLLPLAACGGDWNQYLETIYAVFRDDFCGERPKFMGRPLGLKCLPMEHGKEATFWHFIQEGPEEADRQPDLRRCERIRWPRPVIEAHADQGRIKLWSNTRVRKGGKGQEQRWVLALPDFSYVVVLADRGDFLLPWAMYVVERDHRRQKLAKEFEAWQQSAP